MNHIISSYHHLYHKWLIIGQHRLTPVNLSQPAHLVLTNLLTLPPFRPRATVVWNLSSHPILQLRHQLQSHLPLTALLTGRDACVIGDPGDKLVVEVTRNHQEIACQ